MISIPTFMTGYFVGFMFAGATCIAGMNLGLAARKRADAKSCALEACTPERLALLREEALLWGSWSASAYSNAALGTMGYAIHQLVDGGLMKVAQAAHGDSGVTEYRYDLTDAGCKARDELLKVCASPKDLV